MLTVIAYPLDEVPRFTDKQDHEEELKWVAARLHRKKSETTSGQGFMVEPSEDEFWAGTKQRVDTAPKPIDQDDIDRIWKEDGPLIVSRQTTYSRLLDEKKKREEQEAKDHMDAEIAASKKRKADGTLNAKAKKARQDHDAAVEKRLEEIEARNRLRVAEANARRQIAYEKLKLLQDEANLARYVQEILDVDSKANVDGARPRWEHHRAEKQHHEAVLLEKINEQRKRQGRAPLLPRYQWEQENLGVTGTVQLSSAEIEAARERIAKREAKKEADKRARAAEARQRARQERAQKEREERQAK